LPVLGAAVVAVVVVAVVVVGVVVVAAVVVVVVDAVVVVEPVVEPVVETAGAGCRSCGFPWPGGGFAIAIDAVSPATKTVRRRSFSFMESKTSRATRTLRDFPRTREGRPRRRPSAACHPA